MPNFSPKKTPNLMKLTFTREKLYQRKESELSTIVKPNISLLSCALFDPLNQFAFIATLGKNLRINSMQFAPNLWLSSRLQ